MTLRIQHESFWEIAPDFLLNSRFRFGDRPLATKFVYLPGDEVLVLGFGQAAPSHKALMSSYKDKKETDTSHWVRGIFLRDQRIIYYRQGVRDLAWYDETTRMLRHHGMPAECRVAWGLEAKRDFKEELSGFP